MARTPEEKKRLKRKALVLPVVMVLMGALAAFVYVWVDHRDTLRLEEFLNPKLYNTVEINGVACRRRTRIKTYLFVGVDASGKVGEENTRDPGKGQCDFLHLLIVDQNADTYTMFPISRDTMMQVRSLGTDGSDLGETYLQVSYAHSSGDGREVSCENVVHAISQYLYGQPIDGYLALHMDGIETVNHQLGGVTVTIEDDFSNFDPTMRIGETIKLTDQQAAYFVRYRRYVGDGSNERRMARQDQYLANAQSVFMDKLYADEKFIQEFFGALEDYMVTDLTGKDMSKIGKALRSNDYVEPPEITGTFGEDEFGANEFYTDPVSVGDAVRELFYEEV